MGISKYVSEVKTINHNNLVVYNFLSDFQNFSAFLNEHSLAQVSKQIPNIEISDFRIDTDSCHFTISNKGEAGLKIIEREEPKTIKITGDGQMPFEVTFWIQILPVSAYQSKIRLTLHAELNMMMKMVAGKKLKDGINQIADALCMLPYR